jgi:hypothetical protein
MTIKTAAGSMVRTLPMTKSSTTLDLSSLQSGMYVLTVLTTEGVVSKLFQKGN